MVFLKFGNSLYLPGAVQTKVGCFKDSQLFLVIMLAATAAPLLLLVGSSASIMAWTAAFMVSIVTCVTAWIIMSAFSIFLFL